MMAECCCIEFFDVPFITFIISSNLNYYHVPTLLDEVDTYYFFNFTNFYL